MPLFRDQRNNLSIQVERDVTAQDRRHQVSDEAGAKGSNILVHALPDQLPVPILGLCPPAPTGDLLEGRPVGHRRRRPQTFVPFAKRFSLEWPHLQIAALA